MEIADGLVSRVPVQENPPSIGERGKVDNASPKLFNKASQVLNLLDVPIQSVDEMIDFFLQEFETLKVQCPELLYLLSLLDDACPCFHNVRRDALDKWEHLVRLFESEECRFHLVSPLFQHSPFPSYQTWGLG
jgi:hypothetical protein